MLAPRSVVQLGRDARRSSANVRHPAAAQVPTPRPFVLDGLPGTPAAGHPGWLVVGRAFGACCFAGKLRSPAPPTGEAPLARPVVVGEPYVNGYVIPYVILYALGGAYPCPRRPGLSVQHRGPSGEWSGRAERCASRD